MKKFKTAGWMIGSTLMLCMIAILSLLWGQYPISLETLIAYLQFKLFGGAGCDTYTLLDNIILQIRLPRVLLAILIGSALATSGAAFQAMFVNPLVSPGILGVLAGASFGAALGMLVSEQWYVVQLLAFAFGFVAVGVAVLIGTMVTNSRSTVMLVLGGVISSALFTSLLSIIKYLADPYSTLPAIVYWLMGSLTMADLHGVLLISVPMLASIIGLIVLGKYFDLMSLGDEEAKALGINVTLVRLGAIVLATLAGSLSVVMAGIIGWIGLIIPHIIRMALGPSHRVLMPLSAIVGGAFLLLADTISRLSFSVEIPIGILTSLIGIPIFIIVLKNARAAWN
ncbi:transport system permease protein [Sulfuricurvum kujiense DSM 16994]|uniref:Transport system permease protein n=1 Tax=Sulfuricurvum kujiense (strain ATCC BAA-921 / DSM 16994 / JCM 11577 / YK-1) TaxID=709032 RepID=E4TWX1_SULKY|nr:iron ABC transporter permease [Sulfuricurvum kujiense]ADR33812.1 transport system permease protein [Sulfuricurvum kujiense DSM 16994]